MQPLQSTRRSRSTTYLVLLSGLIASTACSIFPNPIEGDRKVEVRVQARDAVRRVVAGDSAQLGPGSSYFSDSYVLEIPPARASSGRGPAVLAPISGVDLIHNDRKDTIEICPPKRGWIFTPRYVRDGLRVKVMN